MYVLRRIREATRAVAQNLVLRERAPASVISFEGRFGPFTRGVEARAPVPQLRHTDHENSGN